MSNVLREFLLYIQWLSMVAFYAGGMLPFLLLFCGVPLFKGTVPPDFSPVVFFFKHLLLVQVDKPRNDFTFFRKFAEIFDFSGASPMSLTPAKQTILL